MAHGQDNISQARDMILTAFDLIAAASDTGSNGTSSSNKYISDRPASCTLPQDPSGTYAISPTGISSKSTPRPIANARNLMLTTTGYKSSMNTPERVLEERV